MLMKEFVIDRSQSFLLTTRDVIRFHLFSHQTVPCFLLFDLVSSERNSQTGETFPSVCLSACFVLFAVFVRLRFLSHVKPNKHWRTDRTRKMSPFDLYSSQHHSSWSRPEQLQGNLRTLRFTDVIVQWLVHEFIKRPKFFPSSGFKLNRVCKLRAAEASWRPPDRRRKAINIFVNFLFTSSHELHLAVSLLSITFTLVHLIHFYGGSFKNV